MTHTGAVRWAATVGCGLRVVGRGLLLLLRAMDCGLFVVVSEVGVVGKGSFSPVSSYCLHDML